MLEKENELSLVYVVILLACAVVVSHGTARFFLSLRVRKDRLRDSSYRVTEIDSPFTPVRNSKYSQAADD